MTPAKRNESDVSSRCADDHVASANDPSPCPTTPSREAFKRDSAEAFRCADDLNRADEQLQIARHKHEMDYAQEVMKLDGEWKKVLERFNMFGEEKVRAVAIHGNKDVSDDDIIEINAGGKLIDARRGTLTKLKGTRLELLFSGRWDKKLMRDGKGRVFLDVDGDCFQAIVVYLNELASSTEDEAIDPPSVYKELESVLAHQLKLFQVTIPRMFDSNILKRPSLANVIYNWLEEDGSDRELELIHRASRDGFTNEAFYNNAKLGPTIVIIETECGGILGGYSNTSWHQIDFASKTPQTSGFSFGPAFERQPTFNQLNTLARGVSFGAPDAPLPPRRQAPAPANPFGQAPAPANPFGQAPAPANPFGQAPAPARCGLFAAPTAEKVHLGRGARSDKAFLFILTGFDLASPLKLNLKDPNDANAIKVDFSVGPTFGEGPDLSVDGKLVTVKTGVSYEQCPTQLSLSERQQYTIKEMEVFSITGSATGSYPSDGSFKERLVSFYRKYRPGRRIDIDAILQKYAGREEIMFSKLVEKYGPEPDETRTPIVQFTDGINKALTTKWKSLDALDEEVTRLEESFEDEKHFIESFASGDTKDVVSLNVSGAMLYTKRATLLVAEDSVFAQQFDDSKWTVQGSHQYGAMEWTPDEVKTWVESIEGVPEDCVDLFLKNEINGRELLALDKDGLQMLGVERVPTICLLSDEISSLKKAADDDKVTHIEHNPYCFGKILEYLRSKQLHSVNLAKDPAPPSVRKSQQKSFEKVVDYYFPGDSSKKYILG